MRPAAQPRPASPIACCSTRVTPRKTRRGSNPCRMKVQWRVSFDPTIGIMHFQRAGSPAFIFDLMEPERPKIDRAIIELLKSEKLHPADFVIRGDGVARLNPEFARQIVGMVSA